MAASVGNDESVALDAKIRASGEENEAFVSVTEASSEKSSLCSDGKFLGEGESCSKIAGPVTDVSTPKVTEADSTRQAETVESPDKSKDITSKTLVMDGDIHSECQVGNDISELASKAGNDILKHEPQTENDITKHDLQAGNDIPKLGSGAVSDIPKLEPCAVSDIPKQELQAGGDIPNQEPQAGDDILKREPQAGDDITKHDLKAGNDIPKLEPYATSDIPKLEPHAVSDIPKLEPCAVCNIPKQELQAGGDIPNQEPQADDDIPKQELQAGGDIPNQEPQAGGDIPNQEPQAGDDIPKHEPKAGDDIPKREPQAGGDNPKHELGNDIHKVELCCEQAGSIISSDVSSCASPSEKVLPESVDTELNHENSAVVGTLKTTYKESEKQSSMKSTLITENTVGDIIENKNETHCSKLPEMKSTQKEKSELIRENSFAGNVIKQDNKAQDIKLPDKECAHEMLTSEKGFGDIVKDNENITQDHKLPETTSAQKELTSEISFSDSVTESKAEDNKLCNVKFFEENCELASKTSCNKNITENWNRSPDNVLLEVKLAHDMAKLTSEINCADNISENEQKIQDKKLPGKKSDEENSTFHINCSDNITASETLDYKQPETKSAEEKSDLNLESTCAESIIEIGNRNKDNKLPDTKFAEESSASKVSYVDNVTESENKTSDSKSPEMKSTQERSELTSEISFDENILENEQKYSVTSFQDSSSLTYSELDSHKPASNSMNEDQEKGPAEERPVREMLVRRKYSESTETITDKPVLETLTFSSHRIAQASNDEEPKVESSTDVCECLLCDRSYPADNKDILAHLVLMHKFVIADVNFIASLPAYLRYWKARFQEKPISEFCSKIVTNTGAKDQAPKEEFYLLCDALPEDKSIREHLQRKKLESVLAQQQKEREETKFCRQCLFCKQTFCGNRAVLFDHLLRDHTFHMGQPDNLVYTDELFDLIQSKLDNQLCLFCEKSFKDKASLREHMRKKQHRKINPKNKEYDRFYIVNYMEMGKNWESLQSEDNRLIKSNEKETDEEEEWSGWNEESESKVVCLFCDSSCVVQADLQQHMKERHSFDLQEVNNKLQLNFYQKVKLINYIRRQVYHKTCYGCLQTFEDKDKLLAHFDESSDHIKKIPDAEVWDQPQYFFPTYEDDCLLCHLDDDDEGAAGDALGVMVIAETIPVTDTILEDQKLCRELLKS